LKAKENETKENFSRKRTQPHTLLQTAFSQQGTAIAVSFLSAGADKILNRFSFVVNIFFMF
jgi:hypothetical protein